MNYVMKNEIEGCDWQTLRLSDHFVARIVPLFDPLAPEQPNGRLQRAPSAPLSRLLKTPL